MKITVPKHIGFIMDGNGRWAKKRLLPRSLGHREGVKALKRVIDACIDYGVEYVTVYTFSTENWNRPKKEVDALMNLIREFKDKDFKNEFNKPVRVRFIGNIDGLPEDIATAVKEVELSSKDVKDFCLVIALNYGAKDEIVHACNKMRETGVVATNENIGDYLYTAGIPDPDLIVRTGGEKRLSNFLLLQSAYAEFEFLDVLWPDMDKKDVAQIMEDYSKRERKYGRVK